MNPLDDYLSERSTSLTKQQALRIYLDSAPAGKERYQFKVNQNVKATGKGPLKKGVRCRIEKRMKVNGYVRYYAAGLWHKAGDLQPL